MGVVGAEWEVREALWIAVQTDAPNMHKSNQAITGSGGNDNISADTTINKFNQLTDHREIQWSVTIYD